jgi:4,5-dihydroxyphthalate decarboxylase
MKAFNQAKDIAYRRILNPRNVALAWVRNSLEEQLNVLGPDPWEFGLTPRNRKNLETLQRYCAQQGIVRKERPLEELFIDAGRVNIPEEI